MTEPSAFHSPEIVVVEASAGSGKTYALARRYVRLILHLSRDSRRPPPIHSILAITFTNKAALEMKERILRFLKLLALGRMPSDERDAMLSGLALPPAEAKEVAARVMEAILSGYNYFQVQTIDRFVRTLLVGSAFDIGLTGAFRIRTDDRAYMELALDEVIDEAAVNALLHRDLEAFLNNMLLLEARTVWIPREVVLDTVVKLFGHYNSYGVDFVKPTVAPEDIWKLKSGLVADVKRFATMIPEGANATFAKGVVKFAARTKKAFRFNGLGKSFTNADIKMNKGFVATAEQQALWHDIHQAFRQAAELEMKHLCDPYVKLFAHTRERFQALCLKDDVVFLSQLNIRAGDLKGVAPLEMYYRLSTRFSHYLLDEFQDTSFLQWDNLKALPEDAIARGGSLFYVGDKKQAIYSFRGGDTHLFDNIRNEYKGGGYHVEDEPLGENYRSQPAIVAFNNAVFSIGNLEGLIQGAVNKDGDRLIPARAGDLSELARVYATARQVPAKTGAQGYVCVEDVQGVNAEAARDAALQRTLAILHGIRARGFSWKDVALLVRKNDEVAAFTRGLLQAGIPASSERTLNIKEHPHVEEVIAFLTFLESPVEDEAFARAVEGELFLKASGLSVDAVRGMILAWRKDRHAGPLYRQFSRDFSTEWDTYVAPFFRHVGLVPLYELLSSIYRSWGVFDHFPVSRSFLMHLLGLVQATEEDYPGAAAFLARYEELGGDELFVPADDADAVVVTTVHKAKGLDFNMVILPFLAFNAQRERGRGEKSVAYTLRQNDHGLLLYHFNKEHAEYSLEADEEYAEDQMRHFFAELNAVYVALTRARWEMYILVPPRAGGSVNLASWLIPPGMRAVGAPADSYDRKAAADDVRPTSAEPPRCLNWLTFLEDEFDRVADPAVLKDRAFGVALHAVLEHVGRVPPGEEAACLAAALPFLPPGADRDAVERVLAPLLAAPSLREIFEAPGAEVFTEFPVVNRFGDTRRLDRVIVGKEAVVIVDFKTSRADDLEAAGRQMAEYKDLAAALFPGRTVTGKLVFIKEKEIQAM